MTPAELVQKIHQRNGQVTVDGGDLSLTATRPLPADLLDELRAHKTELFDHLNRQAANATSDVDAPWDPAADAKRRQVLGMLAENPGITHAIISDDDTDPEHVIITLAIRGKATCDLRIPRSKYDGLKVMDLIEQYTNR